MNSHPYAELFPMMTDDELRRLADDIRENGQHDPIYTMGGMILDGRNRFAACQLAGVTPQTVEYTGDDPVSFVISKNLNRRHLTESQRGVVASKLANISNGGDRRSKDQSANSRTDPPTITQAEAAELLNVGLRIVQEAKKVEAKGVDGLLDLVMSGEVSMHTASEVANLPPEEQAEVIGQGPEAVKAKASESRAMRKRETKKQEPDTEKRPAAKPKRLRGVGVFFANDALNILHKIPGDDPEMGQAVQIISSWIARNQKGQ